MVGMAQAFAIPSAEVLDEVRCPWDTEPQRLPTGTASSFPSLPLLQGFNTSNEVFPCVLAVSLPSVLR